MKKTGIIVAISITAVTLLSASIIVFAKTTENKETEIAYIEPSKNNKVISSINDVEIPEKFKDFKQDSSEDKIKAKIADKISNSSEIEIPYEEDLEANCNHGNYIENEEESNKNDLKAYEILSKYKGAEYARTDFITDYELDLSYMREMVKLMESGKLSKSEEDILHKYVSRRAYWITDKSVSAEFEKWMLG